MFVLAVSVASRKCSDECLSFDQMLATQLHEPVGWLLEVGKQTLYVLPGRIVPP